jgi:signal transduction histidine kinase/CheY-like chemotaxis protein
MDAVSPDEMDYGQEVRAELRDLRSNQLPSVLAALLSIGWFWFFYIGIRRLELGVGFAVLLLVTGAIYGAYLLRARRFRLACWVALLGLVLALQVVAISNPISLALAYAALPIMAAQALLGSWAALGLTGASIAMAIGGYRWGVPYDQHLLVQTIFFYLGVCLLSWALLRPLRSTAEYALSAWHRLHDALDEARDRRGEVYRALRALEEATFRIERANNELVVAQHEAEEARGYKEQLATTVSHELRGPLNLILGFVRLMVLSPESYGESLPAAYREDLYTVYRNTQHLVSMISDILDLSKIEAQRLPLVKRDAHLVEDIIAPAVAMVRSLVERKGLYLRQDYDVALPRLFVDPVRIRQALLNVLINALRFTAEGGISISARVEDEQVHIDVADTGPGIAATELPLLFREFQQVRPTPGAENQGSGLGLAISRHLLRLHGGNIAAQSQQGVGTTLHLTLPLAAIIDEQQAAPASGAPRSGALPDYVVVVHDDPAVIRALSRYLEDYRLMGLPNASGLAPLLRDLHPRAILATQHTLGDVERLLQAEAMDVPIICCDLPRPTEGMAGLGIHTQLVKPVAPEALLAVMRELEQDGETAVMLVDDEPDAVRLLERMLLSVPRPYRIIKAYDGRQALELMDQVAPDVVLVDLAMPDVGGMDVVRAMRQREALQGVQVVIVSGRAGDDERLVLGTPISAITQRPLTLSNGVEWLRAMLAALPASYALGEASG